MVKLFNTKTLSLGFVVLLVQLFMFINADSIFGSSADYWKTILIAYMLMEAVVFAVPDLRMKVFNVPLQKGLVRFGLGFLASVFLLSFGKSFLVMSQFSSPAESLPSFGIAMIAVHACFVAIVEEAMFRDVFVSKMGLIPAQVAFGLFHGTVYGWNIFSIAMAVVMGFVLYAVKMKFSKTDNTVNAGVHAGWNTYALGLGAIVTKWIGVGV